MPVGFSRVISQPTYLSCSRPPSSHLGLNLKTATALGIDIPPTLLALADEVIE
jgi:hypothetical protein